MPNNYIPAAIQKIVKERANYYCEYCYSPADFSPDSFQFDHIFPVSLGGLTDAANLAYSCGGCNNHKTNKLVWFDPLTNQEQRLFSPRSDIWSNHFQWNEDATLIIGNTPIARSTIALLQMNRPAVVNLRNLLLLAGLHPPTSYPKD